jgi:hypothetical protein
MSQSGYDGAISSPAGEPMAGGTNEGAEKNDERKFDEVRGEDELDGG